MPLLLFHPIDLTEVFINPDHIVKILNPERDILDLHLSDGSIYTIAVSANQGNIQKLIASDWVDLEVNGVD